MQTSVPYQTFWSIVAEVPGKRYSCPKAGPLGQHRHQHLLLVVISSLAYQ